MGFGGGFPDLHGKSERQNVLFDVEAGSIVRRGVDMEMGLPRSL